MSYGIKSRELAACKQVLLHVACAHRAICYSMRIISEKHIDSISWFVVVQLLLGIT